MSLLLIAFFAGILTVLAPCILPLLPVVVGGSLDGKGSGVNLRRAFVVIGSLSVSIILFTLILKVSTAFINIPQEVWAYISGGIIIFFGLISLYPSLWEKLPFTANLSAKSNILLGSGYQKKSIWGDVIIGASLGPVFSTCSPTYFVILATVLPVSFALGIVYLGAYTLGLALALLVIAFVGQKIMGKLGIVADPHGKFKRFLGLLFLLVGIAIFTGYDKKIEANILSSGYFDITTVEQKLLQKNGMKDANTPIIAPQDIVVPESAAVENTAQETTTATTSSPTIATPPSSKVTNKTSLQMHYLSATEKAVLYKKPAELTGIDGYINTGGSPIKISDYKGKSVVLVDIWTYSCINCQRTLPYITSWYGKYKDKGLVVIGVHTPEFAFEHVQKNVEDATKRFGITYPVVLDNNYETWNAFGNRFWPRKYLIDIDGYIVYDHIGEGDYDKTELAIQKALMERSARMGGDTSAIATPTTKIQSTAGITGSPETYFGASRNKSLGNGEGGKVGEQNFIEPVTIKSNTLYLIGKWNITNEYAETSASVGDGATSSDRIDYRYQSRNVYFVAGAKGSAVTMEVTQDGKPLDATNKGTDVFIKDGKSYVTISDNRLYKVVEGKKSEEHLLEFIISSPGLQAYTFTFG